ncbi:hypothetical protein NMG60_11004797 [Bertholletia excelsa]
MALLSSIRRIHIANTKHCLLLLQPVIQPPLPSSSTSLQIHHLSRAFDRTHPVQYRPIVQPPFFSTRLSFHDQNVQETIDFSETINQTHQIEQLGVRNLVEAVRRVDQCSSGEEAIGFLEGSGVDLNSDLVYSAIWALRDDWKLAFLVFKWGEKRGCLAEKIWDLMTWVLGSHKKFNTAWCLIRDLHLSSMDTRRVMLVMIDRYTAANNPEKAIEAFHLMEKFTMTPDLKAFHTLLTILCKHGNIEEAEEFMLLNKKLFPLETDSFNIILNGWCNISVDVLEARRIWREMSKSCIMPNATSYTHMISCFSKVGNLFDSLRLFDEMKKRGWVPGIKVYNSLIYILTRESCLKEALKILDKMKEAGFQPDSDSYNSMIRPLCEAAKLEDAKRILSMMIGENIGPTIETYHAFLENASVDETLEVLNHMKKASVGPNRDTFLLIFGKFFKLKQPENALKIWVEMKTYGVLPDTAHYIKLVEGMASCGFLPKAREFYDEMRVIGLPDDPRLKNLLKEPTQKRNGRNVRRETQLHHGKSSVTRRGRCDKKPRKTKQDKIQL